MTVFTKHNILGATLSLILVGEITVGASNGLFTVPGFIALAVLYLLYFILFDAITVRYKLNNIGLVLINFALYSVCITGLLHGELANYALQPQDNLITTLIRIQCSLFPLFVYPLLKRFKATDSTPLSISKAILLFIIFIVVISPTRLFGLLPLITAFAEAPFITILYSLAALLAIYVGLKQRARQSFSNRAINLASVALLVIGCVPGLVPFLIVLVLSVVVGLRYLLSEKYRTVSSIL